MVRGQIVGGFTDSLDRGSRLSDNTRKVSLLHARSSHLGEARCTTCRLQRRRLEENFVRELWGIAMLIVCAMVSAAQEPATILGSVPDITIGQFQPNVAPPYCKPCLAYGGDYDPNDPRAGGLVIGNTLSVQAEVWVPFVVPQGKTATVTGMFVNVLTSVGVIDPAEALWGIRSRVKPADGGKLVASGTAKASIKATGRRNHDIKEYTVRVKLPQPVTLKGDGETAYWFSLQPQCTNPKNPDCVSQEYFATDTESSRPNHGGLAEPKDLSYYNSPTFHFNFQGALQSCLSAACDWFSMGLLGTLQ